MTGARSQPTARSRWRRLGLILDRFLPERDYLSRAPFPFKHEIENVDDQYGRCVERDTTTGTVNIPLGILLLFSGLLLSGLAIPALWHSIPTFGLFATLGPLSILLAIQLLRIAARRDDTLRVLFFDARALTLAIGLFSEKRGCAINETRGRLEECLLCIHPVHIVHMRNRRGGELATWRGHAVVVHVGDERFVLACDRSREEMERYCRALPKWLRLIYEEEEGPLLKGDGYLRIL